MHLQVCRKRALSFPYVCPSPLVSLTPLLAETVGWSFFSGFSGGRIKPGKMKELSSHTGAGKRDLGSPDFLAHLRK